MILHINTTEDDNIEVSVKSGDEIAVNKKIKARYAQAEKLLPLIEKVLKEGKLRVKDIEKVEVNNEGGSFTALRIGVITANALGYALGIPVEGKARSKKLEVTRAVAGQGSKKFNIIEPIYSKEPNITTKKC